MKNDDKTTLTGKLYCSIFGHNYFLSKDVTKHIKEFKCKSCGKQVTTDVNGNLIDLTPKFKEINIALEGFYNKRRMRLKEKTSVSSII